MDPKEIYFITSCSELAGIGPDRSISQETLDLLNIAAGRYEVFEPVVDNPEGPVHFYADHNQISFYTWCDAECCLPVEATSATLIDKWVAPSEPPSSSEQATQSKQYEQRPDEQAPERALRHLSVGDILIFEEVLGPKTGSPPDADPKHRWAVRLTRVTPSEDPLTETPIVEIEWAPEDALPFPLCLSAVLPAPECELIEDITVARGNVILVDHGRTVCEEIDGVVPTSETLGECVCEGSSVEYIYVPGRFRPELKNSPLTFRETVSFNSSASGRLKQDPSKALPAATLYGVPAESGGDSPDSDPCEHNQPDWCWYPRRDLLESADDRHFVVEIDNEDVAHVRFGDGECGKMPDAGTEFTAIYRIGNGTPGNVAADTIRYMVTRNLVSGAGVRPRNPLPAYGGRRAEPIAEAKLFAPGAFRKKLERAITADDYAQIAALNPKVQRAAAGLRWTGSWYNAHIAIDPTSAETLSRELRKESKGVLYRHRRIGHDLSVNAARYVALHIELEVCVKPHYLRAHVEAALRDVFSNRVSGDGRRGFFHPDNLTFGEGVHLSSLVAAAQRVEGVTSVVVSKLQRLFEIANDEIANGLLPLAGNEIAQLDNNPNFPERGKLILKMNGGR